MPTSDYIDLTDRALLVRVLEAVQRMETAVSAATDALNVALATLDSQIQDLALRIQASLNDLAAAVDKAALADADEAAITAAADQIQAQASALAQLDVPPAV